MAQSVYIESSVISYLVARPSRDVVVATRQAITEVWWQNQRVEFELFVSSLVIQEISGRYRGVGEAAAGFREYSSSCNFTRSAEISRRPLG
jgi:hypothetical protein